MRVTLLLSVATLLRICGDAPPGVPAAPVAGGPFATPMVPGVVPTSPAVPGVVPGTPGVPAAPGVVPGMPAVAVPGVAAPAFPIPGIAPVPAAPVPGVPAPPVGPTPVDPAAAAASPVAAPPGTAPPTATPTPVLSVAEGRHHGTLLVTSSVRFEVVIKPDGAVKLYLSETDGDSIPISDATVASIQFENAGVSTVTMLRPNVGCFEGSATPPPAQGSTLRFDATVRGASLPGVTGTLSSIPPPPAPQAEATPRHREGRGRRGETHRPQAQTFEPAPLPPSRGSLRGQVVGTEGGSSRPRSGGVTIQPGAGVQSR